MGTYAGTRAARQPCREVPSGGQHAACASTSQPAGRSRAVNAIGSTIEQLVIFK